MRPIGDWSTSTTSSIHSSPSTLIDFGLRAACDLPLGGSQRVVQNVMHQRRLARAGNSRDCHQHAQRNRDVDFLQVMRPRAEQLDLASVRSRRDRRASECADRRSDNVR